MTVFTKADALRLLTEDGTSCTIPDTFTSVGDRAFAKYDDEDEEDGDGEFDSLQTVVIPDSITSLGRGAFHHCTSLNINLPNSILSIGICAFQFSALVSITLPNKLTNCGNGCFASMPSLQTVVVPDSLTSIPWCMFSRCSSLTSATIPSSVTECGGWAFKDCSSLKSIIIPDAAIDNPNFGLHPAGGYHDPFEGCTILEALAKSFDKPVKDYVRASFHEKLKEERIRPKIILLTCLKKIILLTCLKVYQKMYEAPSAVAERERKRRKLITEGESGSSSGNAESYEISAEMKVGLPPQMLAIVNMFESKFEESNNKIVQIEENARESNNKIEALAKENKELRREINYLKKVDRNEMHLNAPLAYKMITAFELWREICSFL